MIVAVWLACGALAAALAWSARPDSYPGGRAVALAAGLCGGFLGGAMVILIDGSHGPRPSLSVFGAAARAILLLDLAERTSGSRGGPARSATLAWLWSWALLLDPLLLVVVIAATAGAAADSVVIGVLSGLAIVLVMYWQRNYGTFLLRRWRRYPGVRK